MNHDGARQATASRRPARRESRAQSTLEFILAVPLFLFLMFATLDFSRMFFIQLNLQDAIEQAARFASTGNHLPDPKHPGQNLSRINSITATVQNAAWPGVDLTNIQISSVQGGPGSAGGPSDTVTISLTTSLQLMTPIVSQFFPNRSYVFISSVTFKNEPFSPGDTN